jgi:hypothetical protein
MKVDTVIFNTVPEVQDKRLFIACFMAMTTTSLGFILTRLTVALFPMLMLLCYLALSFYFNPREDIK